MESQLGALLTDMLITMTDRGPDSAGIAIYGDEVPDNAKLTVQSDTPEIDFLDLKSELEKKYDNETDTDVREILASRISRMSSRTVVVRSKLLESEKGIFSDRAGAFFSYFSRCASQGVVPANEDCLVDYLPYSDADLAIRMASYDRKSINNIKAVLRLEDENE